MRVRFILFYGIRLHLAQKYINTLKNNKKFETVRNKNITLNSKSRILYIECYKYIYIFKFTIRLSINSLKKKLKPLRTDITIIKNNPLKKNSNR